MTGRTSIEIVEQIDRVDPQEWDELGQGRPFAEHRWQRFAEAVLLDYEPRYLLLRRQGRLEAGAVCAVQRRFYLSAYLPNRHLRAVAGHFLARCPLLRCGIPIAFRSGLLIRPGSAPRPLASSLLQALQELAAQERAPFIGLYDLCTDDVAWPALRKAGYHVVRLLPDACLEISWPSFESYRARLPRKKRGEFNRERRRAQEAGITVGVLRLVPENEPQIRQLMSNVLRRHDQPDPYKPDFLMRALAIMGEDLTLLSGRQEGQVVACVALLRSGEELLVKWVGLDYSRTWSAYAYHLIMTENVPYAIQAGARRLRCGPTAYELKKRMGAVLEEHFLALAMRGRLFHRLMGLLLTVTGRRVAPGALPVSIAEAEVL